MNNIRVLFVLPQTCTDQSEASDIMLQAYESCRQNVVNVSWVEESKFGEIDFAKTDFIVFQDFTGKNFESVKETKSARILGPWCILVCLMKGHPIPNFTWPIYNVAMLGCVVSCSHISRSNKLQIMEKVQLMGGCYTDSLMSASTHLVTESVKSEKYLQAAERGFKLMTSRWIEAVWEASQTKNIHCDDEEFNKFKCLPFHNLTVSCTGFPNLEMRNQLAQNVAKHGGVFTASLAVASTDVLVVHGQNGVLSKKYKAAKSNPNIYCVSMEWIADSIAKGYALPHNLYNVSQKGTSTPTKGDELPDFSVISAIGDATQRFPSQLEETKRLQPTILFANRISPNKRKSTVNDEVGKLVDGVDIKKAKKAGQYLDGCSVYLAGFKPDQREKVAKILNLSGATRYDDISDRLTHIIVGDTTCPEVKIIKSKNYSVSLVSLHWLLDSMEKQQAEDEENYLINLHDVNPQQFNSPLGKKGLNLLRSNNTMTSNDVEAANTTMKLSEELEVDENLLQQYLKPQPSDNETDTLARLLKDNSDFNSNPDASVDSKQTIEMSSSQLDDRTSQDTNIFGSKKFVILNFPPDESQYIKNQIESGLGTVMSKTYKGIPDYVISPSFVNSPIQISALEIVNHLWVSESVQNGEEMPISYYHRPLVIADSKPLQNCVVTISGYTGCERNFLKELIEALGGVSQEQFARVLCVEKNVQASTHLVSLEADGKKYAAALKWGLPVVSKEWLFECAKSGRFEEEHKFLMGDSKASVRSNNSSGSSNEIRPSTPNLRKQCTPSSVSNLRKILTPVSQMPPLDVSKETTPVNQRLFGGANETPCTQVTPINKLMEEVRRTNLLGTPQTPPMPKSWYSFDTPESPFGAFIKPHLSPKSKKELMRFINQIPDFVPPPKQPKSTPLSEVKRRCWAKLLGNESPTKFPQNKTEEGAGKPMEFDHEKQEIEDNQGVNEEKTDENSQDDGASFINTKLKQIEEMVSAFGESRRQSRAFQSPVITEQAPESAVKDTQPFTVGWDYEDTKPTPQCDPPQMRIFIISGLENDQRQTIVNKIESLGGQVSELSSYDPKCTHLICPKPARNEKTLSCMASGKWILHTSYVDKCVAAGRFLPEEDFEFGNPKSKENIRVSFDKDNEFKLQSVHWWRKEISRRGYGAFNDMRAIVVAQKKDSIIRVIEAGGGQVIDVSPPFHETVHATHCLLEVRSVSDFNVYAPLAQQGILCINTLYISDFLYRTNKDIKDAIVPQLLKFYSW